MSRVFSNANIGANLQTLITPSSSVYNNLTKFTIASWVKLPVGTPGQPTIFVKDPLNVYNFYCEVLDSGFANTWTGVHGPDELHWPPAPDTFPPQHAFTATSTVPALANDVVVVAVYWSDYDAADTLTVTDDFSNTWTTFLVTGKQTKTGVGMAWARISAPNNITITASIPAPNRTAFLITGQQFRGLVTSGSPIDASGFASASGATNTISLPSLTPTQDGDAPYMLVGDVTGTHSYASTTGGYTSSGVAALGGPTFFYGATSIGATVLPSGVPVTGSVTVNGTPDSDWIGAAVLLKAQTVPVDATTFNFFDETTAGATADFPYDDVWVHIIVTLDTTSGDKKPHVYFNGVETAYNSQTAASGSEPDDSGGGWYFGSDSFDGDTITGNIAEVAIWNDVLSPTNIAAAAASTSGVSAIASANLVGYWHLCGLASPEPDSSGNGNSAVLSSNPPTSGPNSPGFSACGSSPVVTRNGLTMISTIQKAVLLATGSQATNYAVYQVDAGPEIQVGETVVIAGCTTGTFNGTFTVAAAGTFVVPNNPSDSSGGVSTWTGFSVIINHAAIGIEVEPTVPTDGAEGSPVGTATATITQ